MDGILGLADGIAQELRRLSPRQRKTQRTGPALLVATMLAVCFGDRALPVLWRVEETEGAIGFSVRKALLDVVIPLLPADVPICLMADRFYGTADLISLW